jgi:hypothetical protein
MPTIRNFTPVQIEGVDTQQKLIEWSSGLPIYKGYALSGDAEGKESWLIFKYTWSGTDMVSQKSATGSWTNRASLTYA